MIWFFCYVFESVDLPYWTKFCSDYNSVCDRKPQTFSVVPMQPALYSLLLSLTSKVNNNDIKYCAQKLAPCCSRTLLWVNFLWTFFDFFVMRRLLCRLTDTYPTTLNNFWIQEEGSTCHFIKDLFSLFWSHSRSQIMATLLYILFLYHTITG